MFTSLPARLAPYRWLILVLMVAAALRFHGINWDQGQHLHPDERFLTMVTESLKWPASPAEYMDEARSPLNPRNTGYSFFAYGVWPAVVVKAAAAALGLHSYDGITLVGRAASSAADVATALLLYFFGLTLYRSRKVALLASALYALSVAAIQQAHFFVVDPFANCAVAGALLLLAKYQRGGRLPQLAGAGVCFGLALSAKLSVALFAGVAIAVCLRRAWMRRDAPLRPALESELFRATLFAAIAFAVFRFAAPDAFASPAPWNILPAPRWLANIAEVGRLVSGEADVPPGHQWAGRTPLLFPWVNMVVWGMGLPLGLAAWAGFGLAASRLGAITGFRHLIPLSWTLILFLHQGTQWAMTLRYFLPVYGCLCLLAAWLILRWRPFARRQWIAWTAVGLTALWALAFVRIYDAPHNRVAASDWIYANVPTGTPLGNEHWDDALPLRMHGHDPFGGMYPGIELHWYHEDNPEKLQAALDWLDRTEYLILSSNRLSDSIPRLPARYPMTTRYYQALFDGSLGFEPAAVFDHAPGWAGLRLPTELAEEAFSVYDHPRVRIFRKSGAYSRANAQRILGDVRWDEVVVQSARDASPAPSAFMLPERLSTAARNAAGWGSILHGGAVARAVPWLPWLLVILLIGTAAWPVLFVFASGLPDRGYALSRIFGLLLVSWMSWFAAGWGWLPFSAGSLAGAIVLVLLVSFALLRPRLHEFRTFLAQNWRLLACAELVFFAAFALMAAVRLSNPDLWHPYLGGEKPMDLAYFTAVALSETFPPGNPWFAGGFINYYYFGFVPAAALLRLTGLPPEVAYNLALPAWYALSASALYAVALALLPPVRRRAAWALLAPVVILLAGNLKQAQVLASRLAQLGSGEPAPGGLNYIAGVLMGLVKFLFGRTLDLSPADLYFRASRAISHAPGEPAPITEFPFFSFLYGDLHAHLLTLPLGILAIGLVVSRLREPLASWRGVLQFGLISLAIGSAWTGNTWELPALAAVLAAGLWCFDQRPLRLVRAAVSAATTLLAAWLAYLPYHRFRHSGYGAVEFWTGSRTPLLDYLIVYGLPLLPVAASVWLLRHRRTTVWADPGARIAAVLALTGFGLTLLVELVVLRGDIGRSNTVFKFGYQAWVLLGLAAAPAVVWIAGALSGSLRRWTLGAGVALLSLGLLYPITATPQRARDRFAPTAPRSWDGLAFTRHATWHVQDRLVPLAGDRALIDWLRHNVPGNPVIAEWNTFPVLYSWGNRIANYTAFPAIVGWDWHLRQQMPGPASERVHKRIAAVQEIYNSPDPGRAAELLRRYEARYIVVGALERALAAPEGLNKFTSGEGRYWDRVFYQAGDAIYRVRPGE
ncbi:MAG TPA: DUF2298 domain-containing protein [Bryobacteraceae bacterium]|nr:DUF2298 domain-containing protein [Bryobacteraceae bacterium]